MPRGPYLVIVDKRQLINPASLSGEFFDGIEIKDTPGDIEITTVCKGP
jgi:hypothetical protein